MKALPRVVLGSGGRWRPLALLRWLTARALPGQARTRCALSLRFRVYGLGSANADGVQAKALFALNPSQFYLVGAALSSSSRAFQIEGKLAGTPQIKIQIIWNSSDKNSNLSGTLQIKSSKLPELSKSSKCLLSGNL